MRELEYKIYGLKIIGEERIYYVGRTMTKLSSRWSKHKTNARLSKTNNYRSNWINKYRDNIEIVLIEDGITTKEEACDKERYYIAFYKEKHGSIVNSSDGGDGGCEGYKHTEEAKAKIGKAHKGKKLSDEHVEFLKNRVISEETRKKLSDSAKKQMQELGNPMTGKKRPDNSDRNKARIGWGEISEETKKKMSKAHIKHGRFSKEYLDKKRVEKIFKINFEDVDNIKNLYKSGEYTYKQISQLYNVSGNYIRQIVKGIKRKGK